MSSHSEMYEQLVIELYVRDFKASCAFYQAFGFRPFPLNPSWLFLLVSTAAAAIGKI